MAEETVLQGNQWSISKRPQKLEDVFGQDQIVKTFKNIQASGKPIPNCMWFEGRYGCGKTTIAKIVAKTIQCKNKDADGNPCNECISCKSIENETFGRNTIMFNAGANGLVDAVRSLIQQTEFPPMVDGNWVVMVEEAQKLVDGGVQALLKTVEVPRSNVYFIFTSMEEDQSVFEMKSMKNFKALKSRCRQFKVLSASVKDLMYYMKGVLESEHLWETLPQEFKFQGLQAIANHCNGSYRSAVQILEECIDGQIYTAQELTDRFGIADDVAVYKAIFDLLDGKGTSTVKDTFINGTPEARKTNFTDAYNKMINSKICKTFSSFDNDDYYAADIKKLASHPKLDNVCSAFEEILDYCSSNYFDRFYCGSKICDIINGKAKSTSVSVSTPMMESTQPNLTKMTTDTIVVETSTPSSPSFDNLQPVSNTVVTEQAENVSARAVPVRATPTRQVAQRGAPVQGRVVSR